MSERMRYLGKSSKDELGRKLMKVVWILTAIVLGLVVLMPVSYTHLTLPTIYSV